MEMSNNPVKHEVLIKQYLLSTDPGHKHSDMVRSSSKTLITMFHAFVLEKVGMYIRVHVLISIKLRNIQTHYSEILC